MIRPQLVPLSVSKFGTFTVDYDQSIEYKMTQAIKRGGRHLGKWETRYASDTYFPDPRKGKKEYDAYAATFTKGSYQDDIEAWAKRDQYLLATPKEGLDIIVPSPRPAFDRFTPLQIAGQFCKLDWGDPHKRVALTFNKIGEDTRYLASSQIYPLGRWSKSWPQLHLLVLREVA